jgi:ribosomal protein L37AE/L43A
MYKKIHKKCKNCKEFFLSKTPLSIFCCGKCRFIYRKNEFKKMFGYNDAYKNIITIQKININNVFFNVAISKNTNVYVNWYYYQK